MTGTKDNGFAVKIGNVTAIRMDETAVSSILHNLCERYHFKTNYDSMGVVAKHPPDASSTYVQKVAVDNQRKDQGVRQRQKVTQ